MSEVVKDLERLRNEEHAALREEFDAWKENKFTKRLYESMGETAQEAHAKIVSEACENKPTGNLVGEMLCAIKIQKFSQARTYGHFLGLLRNKYPQESSVTSPVWKI